VREFTCYASLPATYAGNKLGTNGKTWRIDGNFDVDESL
jgi:hypothetical protein